MGKRSKIYQLIDDNMVDEKAKNQVINYISNLLKMNTELEKVIQKSKKKKQNRRRY